MSVKPGPQVERESRQQCYRCHKPALTCICSSLPRVPNRTLVWLAQHPRERFHPIGTARIAHLGLERVHLEVLRGRSEARPPSLPQRAGLLYPDATARDLAMIGPEERPDALVVIDGTWAQAHTLHRDHRWLARLPHFVLTPKHESRYRLRKEPAPRCVSTIEAIAHALRILEPATPGIDGLLESFDAMIDQQLELIARRREGRRRRERARSHHGIPFWVLREPHRIVIVAFEPAPRSLAGRGEPAVVHLAALRLEAGEVFQYFVAPPEGRFPAAHYLRHVELDAARLESGGGRAALRAAWQRFITPDDIVIGWNASVIARLDAAVGLPARRVELKSIYRCQAKQARGPLDAMLAELGLEPALAAPLCGRAGRHVAGMAALLDHVRAGLSRPAVP